MRAGGHTLLDHSPRAIFNAVQHLSCRLLDVCKSNCIVSACVQRAFKMMVGIGSLRIVNRADPIPSVPAALGLRYRHVGPPVWFDHRGMHLHERPFWEQVRFTIFCADAQYAAQHLILPMW